MKNLLPTKRTIIYLIMIIVGYHVIFSTVRDFLDFEYPMGSYNNTIVAFGTKLRTGILYDGELPLSSVWYMADIQPERQSPSRSGFIGTILDNNTYDYEVEMGWFYQYKTLYAYGRNGFWIIQADPFHLKLWRNENIPAEDARQLDETIAGYNVYGDQFTVVQKESDLTREERNAYDLLKKKSQPRIETLKAQGLFP